MIRTAGLLVAQVLALALALGLSGGCSAPSGSTSGPPEPTARSVVHPAEVTSDHNDTDLAYVDRLGSQHQQATDMVVMVDDKVVSSELREIAAEIGRARSDEMPALRRMATAWGASPHTPHFHGNPGELSAKQLSELHGLDGSDFERRWASRMIDNHLGASAMSKAELDAGQNLGTRQFARGLIRVLDSQIEALQALQQ